MPLDLAASATVLLAALRAGRFSARELLEAALARIAQQNGALNALVALNPQAAEAAAWADRERAAGRERPLLGLPVTVKDAIDVAGLPTTAGVASRKGAVAGQDATAVARLRAAGAVIVGKSNLPPYAGDWQTDNRLFGRSNNPWDLSRTPGGSTGGGAAAVAAGFSALDVGSDLAGSLRLPAAFTGIVGHRPSAGIVPMRGSFGGDGLGMTVLGPLARQPADLAMVLDVLGGAGWQRLPAPRHDQLSSFRIAVAAPPPWLPVDAALWSAVEGLVEALRGAGATVMSLDGVAWPDQRELTALFQRLLSAITAQGMRAERRASVAAAYRQLGDWQYEAAAEGFDASGQTLAAWLQQRGRLVAHCHAAFEQIDLIIAPTTLGAAFPHDDRPLLARQLIVEGSSVPYLRLAAWPALASLPQLPATAIPVGQNEQGLPLGLQLIGPPREDRTPLRAATLIGEALERKAESDN